VILLIVVTIGFFSYRSAVGEDSGERSTSRSAVARGDGSTAPAAAVAASGGVPSFAAQTLDGQKISSSSIEGPAIVKVFASWCPTCQAEAADFAAVQKSVPGISYYYLNVGDEPADAEAFLAEHSWKEAPVISDKNRKVEEKFRLTGQPHTIFIDSDEQVSIIRGPGSKEDLLASAQAIV
jgi:thiol-disulfide isomerase/thioredoxin